MALYPNLWNMSTVSDNWFETCHVLKDGPLVALAETYRRTIHFDSVATIMFIILITLPMLFKIYGFGVQTQLRQFYNRLFSSFTFYLMLIGISMELSALYHTFVNQQPACMGWSKNRIFYNLGNSPTPNVDLIVSTILAEALISYGKKGLFFRFVVAFFFVLMDIIGKVAIGATSVSGAIASVSFGLWIIFYAKFVPPIVLSASCLITVILGSVSLGISSNQYGFAYTILKDSHYFALRGLFITILSQTIYIHYGFTRDDFSWLGNDWDERFTLEESDSGAAAEIPRMDIGTKSIDFGKVLSKDIIVSVIAFSTFLVLYWIIGSFIENNFQPYN